MLDAISYETKNVTILWHFTPLFYDVVQRVAKLYMLKTIEVTERFKNLSINFT